MDYDKKGSKCFHRGSCWAGFKYYPDIDVANVSYVVRVDGLYWKSTRTKVPILVMLLVHFLSTKSPNVVK